MQVEELKLEIDPQLKEYILLMEAVKKEVQSLVGFDKSREGTEDGSREGSRDKRGLGLSAL
jgi:hypothetical protein